jgi:hypothetical protein
MPVTNFDYRGMSSLPDVASVLGINNLNSINSLLNDDEDEYPLPPTHRHTSSIDNNTILRAETTSEEFPILVRRPGDMPSSSHQSNAPPPGQSAWQQSYLRHRHGQQSLPMNTLRNDHMEHKGVAHSRSNSQALYELQTPTRRNPDTRKSMDVIDLSNPDHKSNRSSLHVSPPHASSSLAAMPNLRSSFSTNDVPTINNLNISNSSNGALSHAEQHLAQHNASIGRVPQANPGHRREPSGSDRRLVADTSATQPPVSHPVGNNSVIATQYASVPPQAMNVNASNMIPNSIPTPLSGSSANSMSSPTTNNGPHSPMTYIHPQYATPMNGMPVTGMQHAQWGPSPASPYGAYYGYWYPQYNQVPRVRDSQQAVIQQRRNNNYDGGGKF